MNKSLTSINYIKEHFQSDLAFNQDQTGRDFSSELAEVLHWYLSHASEKETLLLQGMLVVSTLEQQLRKETGKFLHFHETKKCSSVIYRMWQDADVTGFIELQKYVYTLRNHKI